MIQSLPLFVHLTMGALSRWVCKHNFRDGKELASATWPPIPKVSAVPPAAR